MKQEIKDKVIDDNLQYVPKGEHGKLPNALKVFKYGIVASCTSFVLVGFVFAIIALRLERKDMAKLRENYQYYKYEKWKLVVGKSLAWASFGLFFYIWGYTMLMIGMQGGF